MMSESGGGTILHAIGFASAVLLSFVATLAFVPKGATLIRVGAIVALGCIQYSFYTAVLNSSLTRAQISDVCLISWGLFMNGAEQILLSRYNVDDLDVKSEVVDEQRVGTSMLLFRAAGMYFNLRRVGVRGEISMKPRAATSRSRLLCAKIVEVLVLYLIMDLAMSAPLPEAYLVAREKQTLFKLSNLTLEDVAFRTVGSVIYWFVTYICNRLNSGCAVVISLSLGLSQPKDWPHLNGPISACYTVRGFWGTFWHQLYRKSLTGWGDFVSDKVLRLRRGTLLSRYTRLFLAFLTSGAMHHCMHYIYRFTADESFSIEKFYVTQALGIMFEDAVQAASGNLPLSQPVRRAVGYIWVLVFFAWSTPIASYPSMRGGDPGQMVPFSVMGSIMKP
ncbi:acetyltransferase [Fusarium heterosporum]|uniref:Acetyltransferase n=1 Tax=Fusarium heterosporum TaxID=42747 RepID=A0A8H5TPQ6_FUSHE|nr:acetyltransferase [Fusarium heterosporum]